MANNLRLVLKTLPFLLFCWSCTHSSEIEKKQSARDNVTEIRDKVKAIDTGEALIGGVSRLYLLGDYLIIGDGSSYDKLIHLFDKNNFSYVTSVGYKGEGPDEITNMGYIGINESAHEFYVSDHGKQVIFSYNIDSVLVNPDYKHKVKMKMNQNQFPSDYRYINDTLCVGRVIEPIGSSDFKPTVAKWNISTGEIKLMKYEHPEIEKKRISFAVSPEHNIYAECYSYHDLITICGLDGKLKCNIYGPKWDNRTSNKIFYFGKVVFCGDKLLTLYSGEDTFVKGQNGEIKSNLGTKFLVFDINGDYIQTLETGYRISDFCYDKKKNRLIMSLDDESVQFAYLSLEGVV